MKTVCLYFQVHQPWRLKKYRFFNMGKDHNYLDDLMNRSIMQKVARQCYLPMNALLLKLIRENKGKFRCSFSITGIAIEQFRAFAPEVLDSFKELAATGCVEFLAETYSHSLASLASKEDFTEQVKLHTALIKKEFGVKPYIDDKHQGPIITTFYYPDSSSFSFQEMYDYVKERGYAIYPGKVTEADTFRIGNIGEIYEEDILKLADIFRQYFKVHESEGTN